MKPQKLWNRNFILMMQGSFISKLGDILYSIAIGWYVYEKTGSEAMLGIFTSIALFSSMLLSPLAGAIADKVNRKSMLVGLDALRGALMLLIGILCLQNKLPLSVLIVLTLFISVSGTFFNPCTTTVFIDIVPSSDLIRAHSLHSVISNFVQLAGKAISGFLLIQCGIGWLIFFNGISFLFSALSECFLIVPQTPNQGSRFSARLLAKDIVHGFVTAATTDGLNHLFFCIISINLFTGGNLNLLLIFTQQNGFSLAQYGILMSVISAGGILASLTIAAIKIPCDGRAFVFTVSAVGMPVLFCCAFLCRNFYIICALMFAAIALNFAANMILNAALMLAIPINNRAAVLGVLVASSTGGDALSTVAYGFLAQIFSIRFVGAAGMLLALLPMLALVMDKKVRQMLNADATDFE